MKLSLALVFFLFMSFYSSSQTLESVTSKIINYTDFVRLFQQKGNDTAYVVNFWATWCRPCLAEIPDFVKLDSTYKNTKIKVVFVSLDFKKNLKNVNKTADLKKMRHVYLMDADDPNKWITETDNTWSGSIPATLVYQNGEKMYFHEGALAFHELEQLAKKYVLP